MAVNTQTLDANESTTAIQLGSNRPAMVMFAGTFDSASIAVEVSADNSTFVPALAQDGTALAYTIPGALGLEFIPDGLYVRFTMSSAGGSSDVDVSVVRQGDIAT